MRSNMAMINNKKKLSQFYTSYELGVKMISLLPSEYNISNVIDLSIGEGALVDSVIAKYPNVEVFGVDIDTENIKKIKTKYHDRVHSFQGDSTTKSVFDKLKKIRKKFDLDIGNPPFSLLKTPPNFWNSFSDFFPEKKNFRAENLFLLNGLSLLEHNGVLAYILPNGFFTNQSSFPLRKFISSRYKIIEIMNVSNGHFSGTDANTHIIIIQNTPPVSNTIKLTHMENRSKAIYISIDNFIYRGDYNFYNKSMPLSNSVIDQFDIQIIRGSIFNDKNKIKDRNEFLHTTNFIHLYNEFGNSVQMLNNSSRIAKEGDIVIPRVGSRCIGKVGVITSGCFNISDCLIIIRCNDKILRKKLINSLVSKIGRNWLKSIARGVGAKHLTINDIKQFPITI